MKAIVVYESLWGNTAAVAKAIAEGIGAGTKALATDEATAETIAGADLIVAGAPLLGFSLPTEAMHENIAKTETNKEHLPDLSHPTIKSWLDALPKGQGRAAAFETRIWWSPGSAAKAILKNLQNKGYSPVAETHKFIVKGKYGPLKNGELERAREWGKELADSLK
jgi:flavorubredoxin